MILKEKAYFLKKGINPEELGKYGFVTYNNESWWKDIKSKSILDSLVFYKNDRIFKIKSTRYSWTVKVKEKIKDLIEAGIVYQKHYYYAVGWNTKNWSDKKMQRVANKINKLQSLEDIKNGD